MMMQQRCKKQTAANFITKLRWKRCCCHQNWWTVVCYVCVSRVILKYHVPRRAQTRLCKLVRYISYNAAYRMW